MAVQRSPAMVQRCHKLCNAAQRCVTWSSDGIPSRALHNVAQTLPNASQRCQTAVQRFSTMSEHMALGSLEMTSSSLLTTLQQRCTTGARRCPAKVQCCYKLHNVAQHCLIRRTTSPTLPHVAQTLPDAAQRCQNGFQCCSMLLEHVPHLWTCAHLELCADVKQLAYNVVTTWRKSCPTLSSDGTTLL